MCVRRREFSRARGDRGKEYHFDLKRIAADARAVASSQCIFALDWRFDDSRPNALHTIRVRGATRRYITMSVVLN